MSKHKYQILGNIKTITVLFSLYNQILLSTLETSCGNIWNCLNLLKWNSEGLLFSRTLLKQMEQEGYSTRGGNEENHPFLVEERSTPLAE